MDSLTHLLLGAATAQMGFRQKLGREATWVAAVAGAWPDIDVPIAWVLGQMGYRVNEVAPTLVHRGITHSLLAVPIFALLASWLWWLLAKRRWQNAAAPPLPPVVSDAAAHPLAVAARNAAAQQHIQEARQTRPVFWPRLLCIFLAALSHPILDWCTSYGTELLSPFSRQRFALDALPIVEIFFTGWLIVVLLACWLVRRRARGGAAKATAVMGIVGILVACSYAAAGRVFHDRVVDLARQAAGADKIVSAEAYPTLGTIFLWRAVVRTDGEWLVARARPWYDTQRIAAGWKRWPQTQNAWTKRAAETEAGKTFIDSIVGRVRYGYAVGKKGEHVVDLSDMRYARTADGNESFRSLRVTFAPAGKLLEANNVERPRRDLMQTAQETWGDLWKP
jgi:inner membrane protein